MYSSIGTHICIIAKRTNDDQLKARVLLSLVNGFVKGKDCLVMKCDWLMIYKVKIM